MSDKKCPSCLITKKYEEFGLNKNTKDGRNCYCKICNRKRDKEYHKQNRKKQLKKISQYYQNNKQKRNEYQKKRYHERMKTDPLFVLKRRYRLRTAKLFRYKNIDKISSCMTFLGCTPEDFKIYFESKFTEGMTWEKVFSGEIHIDHIIPISSATTEEELKKLSHYTNLQPLWAVYNLKKSDKFS